MIDAKDTNLDIPATLSNNTYIRAKKGSKHQRNYEIILDHIANVRFKKCEKYGESRYEEKDLEFNIWMCFGDIHRKYIRLRTLNKLASQGDKEAIKSLKDAYLDIANYGVMGFQILHNQEHILEKEETKK